VYNNHPWESKIVAVVGRWLFSEAINVKKNSKQNLGNVAVADRWLLFRGVWGWVWGG